MLEGQQVNPEVKKRLVFSEAIQQQLKINWQEQQTISQKKKFYIQCRRRHYKKISVQVFIGFVNI